MIAATGQAVLLADSSKFQQTSFCDVCGAEKIQHIVTDDRLPARSRKALEKLGVKLTIVPVKSPAGARP